MSIQLGIYDLFSYLIPGVLYLYVINAGLTVCKSHILQQGFGICQKNLMEAIPAGTPELAVFALGLTAAFIAGHLLDMPAHWLVFRLIYRKRTAPMVLETLKEKYRSVNITISSRRSDFAAGACSASATSR